MKMPARKSKRKMVIRGNGWLSDVWDGIKSVAGPVNDVLKSTKILSAAASAIPQTRAFAPVVGALGYGKRRRKMKGGSIIYDPAVEKLMDPFRMRGRGASGIIKA